MPQDVFELIKKEQSVAINIYDVAHTVVAELHSYVF